MNQARVIYHLARADFLERVRRYSFLIMLGLVVFLGYQAAIGNIYIQVGEYRGEFNSAWVGSMMSRLHLLSWVGLVFIWSRVLLHVTVKPVWVRSWQPRRSRVHCMCSASG